jgi:hypothetical protein
MADLSITATAVVPSDSATKRTGKAGAAITAGQPLYKDSTTKTMFPADANVSTKVEVAGIAAHAASTGQPITYVEADDALVIGATVAIGDVLILSANAGGIAPVADLVTGWFCVIIGVAVSTTEIKCNFTNVLSADAAKA